MKVVHLKVEEMTRETFAPFGILIDSRGSVEIDLGQGSPSLTGATSERRDFRFDFMSRHKGTMQVFSPLASSQSIIAVAPPCEAGAPEIDKVRAFLVNGRFPYAYHRGTWHTPPFAVGEWASYLVIDRTGTLDDDWELVDLKLACNCTFEIET
ncbi:MAG TPA: ureidoglycolate lyase [Pyrinomonadaceae bacterium]|nr:ureidoglycolate lyase [Pyrinomonadaceae bacterium]